jgi:hypothetical protein
MMPESMMSGAMMPQAALSASGITTEKNLMCSGGSMNNDELDHILSEHEAIQPSSGFAAAVMEAVRDEATAPPPIPFPWKRALPVLVFAALTLAGVVIAVVVAIVQSGQVSAAPQATSSSWSILWSMFPAQARGTLGIELSWTAGALLTAFLSVKFAMRLATGRA